MSAKDERTGFVVAPGMTETTVEEEAHRSEQTIQSGRKIKAV